MGVCGLLVPMIGTLRTHWIFRVRLSSPFGTVLSGRFCPNRGVPQGGFLSPLLWALHINALAEQTKGAILRMFPNEKQPLKLLLVTYLRQSDVRTKRDY